MLAKPILKSTWVGGWEVAAGGKMGHLFFQSPPCRDIGCQWLHFFNEMLITPALLIFLKF